MFRRLFVDHPASVQETYGQHFRVAMGFGVTMLIGALGAILHAFVPAFCKTKGSDTVRALHLKLARDPARDGRPEYEI